MSKILSVTRSRGKGDSFEIELESNGCPSCEQYGAMKTNSVAGSRCSCSCNEKGKRTFYTTHTGEMRCVKDKVILADVRRGDTCGFYFNRSQQFKVLNLQANGQERLQPNDLCDQIQITGWKFYLNSSWTSFPADDAFGKKPHSATTFSWNGNPDFLYQGFLIKVMFQCTHEGTTDTRCLIFKAEGTHQYFNISTTTPPTHTSTEKSSVEASNEENTETNSPLPTVEYSKANDKKIWIAVSLGLSGVVLIAIIAIVVFLVLRCRRNCKQETTESRRHPPEQPSESAFCSPLHDYEYVHYPCLVNGLRSPRKTTGNAMYERGEDNKLIIWTPGHSGTLTRPAETAAPRLPYQRLLTRTSSSTPDSATGIRPVSSPGMETDFPYQKLVRATTSLPRTAGTSSSPDCANVVSPAKSVLVEEDVFPYQELFRSTPSLKGEAPWRECGQKRLSEVESNGEGVSTTPYQTLSLQRNQLYPLDEFDGYARVEDVDPQTEDFEYDYARVEVDPVELRNLFRISHSDDTVDNTPNTCMEVTIGDLSNTASIPKTIVSESSPSQSCRDDSDSFTCEDVVKRKSDCCVHGNEWLKPQNLHPAASYEDLSGGRPEEYEEMGKRRSVMTVEDNEPTEIENDNGHEYYVLEAVDECDEGESDDAH